MNKFNALMQNPQYQTFFSNTLSIISQSISDEFIMHIHAHTRFAGEISHLYKFISCAMILLKKAVVKSHRCERHISRRSHSDSD